VQLLKKIVCTRLYAVQLWGSASGSNIDILERFQSEGLRTITDAPWFLPNAVIIRDLPVLSVSQEVRNYSVTYRQRLNDHHNSLAKSLFQRPNYNRRLKRYYPADLASRFRWYSATPPQTIPNQLWLSLQRRCITGRISYMSLMVTVNTIAECLRTDCNILGDKKADGWIEHVPSVRALKRLRWRVTVKTRYLFNWQVLLLIKKVVLTFCWPCNSVYLSQYLTNLMQKICFTISFISCLYMFRAHVLIIWRSKLHYTASGIITPIGFL